VYGLTSMIFLVEPGRIVAWNTRRWEGWVRSPARAGAAVDVYPVVDSYLQVRPRHAPRRDRSAVVGAGALVAGAVACLCVVIVVRHRGRRGPVEAVGP